MKKTVILLLLVGINSMAYAQSLAQPQGFYSKTGGDGINQWYQVLATEQNQYAITDIYGQGFTTDFNDGLATVINSNEITVAGTTGNPSFNLSRMYGTDSSFPLTADNFFSANQLFNGDWNISELLLEPITGEVLQQFDGSFEFIDVFTLTTGAQSVRFTDSLDIYFQGVMIGSDQLIFRRLRNDLIIRPTEGPYASIPSSSNNFDRDIVGVGTFTDVNHFEVLLALQAYFHHGLSQFYLTISGTRVTPLMAGDVNADGVKNQLDRDIIVAALGLVKDQDDGFNIAHDLNQDGLIDDRDLSIFDGNEPNSEPITSAMTALWYDPTHDGEGWDLQILNQQTAHLSWYTFDENGEQMWVTGLGSIDGSEIEFPNLSYASQGTQFGESFNPDDIVQSDWGSVNINFETCNDASLSYVSRAGFGSGSLKPTRLLNHSGLDCLNEVITPADINPFTGLWYDPSHNGEGWIIQVNDSGAAFISWYTYDENAQPMWMVGSGTVEDNVLTVDDLVVTSGAIFGTQFNPDDVQRTAWGSLTFTLNGCHQGNLTYSAIRPELGSGTLNPVRIASVAELNCVE